MKNLFTLALILLGFIAKSQVVIDSTSGKVYVDNVHEIGLDKKDLKEKANRWVAKTYNNSNYVTRINNEDNILTKGLFNVGAEFTAYGATVYSPRKIEYTLDLKFKEGRYKIEISNLMMNGTDASESISIYFMTYEEYKKYSLQAMESYEGIGKKAVLKRINNDNKFRKDYKSQQDYGKAIIPQIIDKLESIDLSLLAFLKDNTEKDDW